MWCHHGHHFSLPITSFFFDHDIILFRKQQERKKRIKGKGHTSIVFLE